MNSNELLAQIRKGLQAWEQAGSREDVDDRNAERLIAASLCLDAIDALDCRLSTGSDLPTAWEQ